MPDPTAPGRVDPRTPPRRQPFASAPSSPHAGGAPINLSAKAASALLAKVRRANSVEAEQKHVARDLVADVRRLDRAIGDNRKRCQAAVGISGTSLTSIPGISDVPAAKIIGQIGDIARFPSSDHLASSAGTAPTGHHEHMAEPQSPVHRRCTDESAAR